MKRQLFIYFLFFIFSFKVLAIQLETVKENNKGVQKLKSEETQVAYEKFLYALNLEPFNSDIRLNLGLTFEHNKEPEKAAKEYMSAYRYSIKEDQQFIALFNAGNAFRDAKNNDMALQAYQKALTIKPDSKDVKKNIELMWQGGGGGGGSGENQNPNENQQPGDSGQQPPQQQQKPKPKEFDSEKLTQKDVNKILEELKNQEQEIRAKEYEKGSKSVPKDKDW
jgi:tetratricopeptide (TPR) repeat protein